MTHPRHHLPVLDRIEAALEAICGALMSLESSEIRPVAPGAETAERHVAAAIPALRHAVGELRAAQQCGASGLAVGFVLPQNDGPERRRHPSSAEPAASRVGRRFDPHGPARR